MTDWEALATKQAPKKDWEALASQKMQDVRPAVDSGEPASIGDIAIASLADDWRAQARYYAKQRGINPDQYRMRDGILGYEDSKGFHPEVPAGGGVKGFFRHAAQGVGPAIPAVTATVGGLTTLPVGGGIPGAIGGAAFGQAGREAAAAKIMGQDVSYRRIVTEGALEGSAQLAGALVAKGLSKTLASRAAKEVFRKISKLGMNKMSALEKTAQEMGLRLTPAELTNLPGLKAQQKALQGSPVTADRMGEFYASRGAKVNENIDAFLRQISPTDSSEVAGESLQNIANKAMDAIKAERAAQGSPAYQKAFAESGPINMEPVVDSIKKETMKVGKTTRKALKTVMDEMYQLGPDGKPTKVLRNNLEDVQNTVKEELDNQIGKAVRAGNNKTAASLLKVKDQLLAHLDEASPAYKEARAKWGDLSREVNAAEGGVLAATAKTNKLTNVARDLFNNGPLAINTARKRALKIKGGEEAWNGVVRSYLEEAFTAAKKVPFSSIGKGGDVHAGAKWWAQTFGDKSKQLKLRAALSPDQFRALRKMMDVLEATGRAVDTNSDTAFKMEAQQQLKNAAGGGVIGNINIPGALRKMEDAYRQFRYEGNAKKLAEVITSPDAIKRLNEIYTLSPKSKKAIIAVAHVLGFAGKQGASSLTGQTDTYNPSGIQPPQPQGQ